MFLQSVFLMLRYLRLFLMIKFLRPLLILRQPFLILILLQLQNLRPTFNNLRIIPKIHNQRAHNLNPHHHLTYK
ncbi:hypothetical protein C2G38_2082486 [Gigaspora rosea]|uniref:Uncharacterized protein n=1 Tax=Gigaspora rosea TaxID=44941 RepID=A0A397VKL0_9GLOM|nr:hypothetical protein C2G38_2082486 [Gigaspora rosea]